MPKPDSGAAVEHEDPATEQPDDEKPQEKVIPKGEEKTAEERRKDKEAREDGPIPGSPRWNEVYGKWKSTERKLEEREKDFEAIREHNRALETRLNDMETRKADRPPEPEPDPAVDPEAYKQYHKMLRLKEREELEKQRVIDRHEVQVEMQKELHEDYNDMIKIAERDMKNDPQLHKKIWVESGNPAKAAYHYGKQKEKEMQDKEREEESRTIAKKQTETEPEGEGGKGTDDEPVEKVTSEETRVIKNLFPDMPFEEAKKKYIKQKKAMGRT